MRDRFHPLGGPVESRSQARGQPARQTGGANAALIDPAPHMARPSNLASSALASAEALAARTPSQPQEDVVSDPKELAARYVAVWIEPDTERRRKRITQVWAEDGVHVLEPPQQVRETAATLGMTLRSRLADTMPWRSG
jgi:hypothetical protein